MHHIQFRELMDDYLTNELTEHIKRAFEEHMLACRSCRKNLMLSQAIVDVMHFLGRVFFFEEIVENMV